MSYAITSKKTGADRGNILGQPMLFECMGICVLSPVHESEMRGYLVYVLIVNKKYLVEFFGIFCNISRGVCRPYHLQRLYSESALFYLL